MFYIIVFSLLLFEDLEISMSYIDRFKEQQNEIRHPDSAAENWEMKLLLVIIAALLLIVVVFCVGLSLFLLRINREKIKKLKTGK